MSEDSVFNISSSSLTLGAVLAKGSPGVTLYRAELQLGMRPMEVTCNVLKSCGSNGQQVPSLVL